MKARGIQVGTKKYLVVDPDVYDIIEDRGILTNHIFTGKHFAAYGWGEDDRKFFMHDFVMELHGMKKGVDYGCVEFLDTFGDLVMKEDYDFYEILEPPSRRYKTIPLDVRFSNLRPIPVGEVGKKPQSEYRGVSWDKTKKRWQAYLTPKETGGKLRSIGRYLSDKIAARQHDLACVEAGLPDSVLNFPYSDYVNEEGLPIDPSSIQAIKVRTMYNSIHTGFEAAVFDNPKYRNPKLVFKRFYPTSDEARKACEEYIKGRFGPLFEPIFLNKERVTSEKFAPFCQRCQKPTPLGVTFFAPTPKGSLKVCEKCFEEMENKDDSDLPDPAELLREPDPFDISYKKCNKCGKIKPDHKKYFPTYKYKDKISLKGTCRACYKELDKQRYQARKKKTE